MTASQIRAELREVNAEIDAAYWRFTRQARAKPPILQVPHAYARRKELEDLLRAKRSRRSSATPRGAR